jgi:hypothetical protein
MCSDTAPPDARVIITAGRNRNAATPKQRQSVAGDAHGPRLSPTTGALSAGTVAPTFIDERGSPASPLMRSAIAPSRYFTIRNAALRYKNPWCGAQIRCFAMPKNVAHCKMQSTSLCF